MPLPKILALIMVVSMMFGAGLSIDRARLLQTLRQYGLLGRAFLANFVLVPLFAILLVRFFHVEAEVSFGIVLMSMAPGVPFLVNSAGRGRGGSLSFALTISFVFAAISVLTIPVTAALVFPPDVAAKIPAAAFFTTLVGFQLTPLVIGALIAPRLPVRNAEMLAKVSHLVFLVAALVLAVVIFPRLVSSITVVYGFGRLTIIAAICVFSIAIGWLLGGPDEQYRRTLSIATLMRNLGLCALIATSAGLADTPILATVFAYFIVSFVLSLPVQIYFKRTTNVHSPHTEPA